MNVYVFTGPTLEPEEARGVLDAVYLPPVAQGDVYRVTLKRPHAIGIIDGYFERIPSVWHKEILWAMKEGIHVFGSASMGALRAAELAPFGMEGVGVIFEAYRDGHLEDDDEVAVVHGPAEMGFRGGSEAMVNIRATLSRAARDGIVTLETCTQLERIAKALFYPDRSYARLLDSADREGVPRPEIEQLKDWLPGGQVNQKREDALAMLCVMNERITAGLEPKQVSFWFEHTENWDRVMAPAGTLRTDDNGHHTVLSTLLLQEMRLENSYRRTFDSAFVRYLARREGRRQQLEVTGEMLQETGDRFRAERGLHDGASLAGWLREHDLTLEAFSDLLKEVAMTRLVERWAEPWVMQRLTTELLLEGEYDGLTARVLDKQHALEAAGRDNPALADTGLAQDELLRWYFLEYRGEGEVPDVDRYARALGFPDREVFLHAVLREYWYVRSRQEVSQPQS